MSHNLQEPSPPRATNNKDTCLHKSGAIDQSKVQTKGRDEEQGQPQKVLYLKVENPQIASKKIQVVYNVPKGPFVYPKPERLCPKGTWEAICWIFFIGCGVAIVFFIIDMVRHGKL